MERLESKKLDPNAATKVWSVAEFCRRHRLKDDEEKRLRQLFGHFATARELLHNAKRPPKCRR
ncbi:hypothetical protein SAMN05216328_13957 [Ensifer sp. YR511]|nr:hypothetical protein [Ensifer sp. YR511]SDN85133.1 hypothetical protein SAMN05216328_13957 [Ensifer sp. YR511]